MSRDEGVIERPHLLICMGMAGSGKAALARAIAARFELIMLDANDFQPASNRLKLAGGMSLSDADRKPWMDAVCRRLDHLAIARRSCVLAHSALRRQDRDRLRSQRFGVSFINLLASRTVLKERLTGRKAHCLPLKLLNSQLDDLQSPLVEADVFPMDATLSPEALAERVVPLLDQSPAAINA
ncbi:MAG: gluconokinase, GntK/IdnK-type [Pseudomonadota bacterium]